MKQKPIQVFFLLIYNIGIQIFRLVTLWIRLYSISVNYAFARQRDSE